ncbi:MAG TPA: glycoside hydrolase family 15 protein [Methanotrichaceae archaeon]|nr:glycoside hydrolase family 15 protein [Methanotrichaceae archaeon]
MDRYKPISDYGAIGNLRTAALVCRDGSVDWCCFPYLDSPSVFASILDAKLGGCFRVSARGPEMGNQRYIPDTNVLKTQFKAGQSQLILTDFMPIWGDIHGFGKSYAYDQIHRILECRGGDVAVEVEWSPRPDYARAAVAIKRRHEQWQVPAGDETVFLCGLEEGEILDEGFGPVLHGRFRMMPKEKRVLITGWGGEAVNHSLERSQVMMDETVKTWRGWAYREEAEHHPEMFGEHFPLLIRSELVLKMISNADNGAIAAAPTTSLPEDIGGVRNWDYRYAWIRDGFMTAQALISLGHRTDALEFLHWIEEVSEASFREEKGLSIMHRLNGSPDVTEMVLSHLEGYQGSKPVRIGNAASDQLQLGIYGELLDTGFELIRRGERLKPSTMDFLSRVADFACSVWREPDHGIWEMRGPLQHFTSSKIMVWVALDRAVHLAERYGLKGDVHRWRRYRDKLRKIILDQGFDKERNSFVIHFGSKDLDAANLRIPMLGFLPAEDSRVQGTIDRTMEELTENGLVYRYICDDGLPGKEGAFGLCTFWLVDALALSGRLDEAWSIFEGVVGRANHLGLFPEQFNPRTGEFLGNFPQAYTHIGMINSAIYLAHTSGQKKGPG